MASDTSTEADEGARRLSEQELVAGGLEPVQAFVFRDEPVDGGDTKDAARMRTYREKKREQGLEQVNLFAPKGERPKAILRAIAASMDGKEGFLQAAEMLADDEEAWQVLVEPRRTLALALSRPANDNLADLARRALEDDELGRQLAAFCALDAEDRASLLAVSRDPALLRLVARCQAEPSLRNLCHACEPAAETIPAGSEADAEAAAAVGTLLGARGAPLRTALARAAADPSLPDEIEAFSGLDPATRRGSLKLARNAPAIASAGDASPDLGEVLAALAALPEAKAVLHWLTSADAFKHAPGEASAGGALGNGPAGAPAAAAGSVLLRWRQDPPFREALAACDADRLARLVSKVPPSVIQELADRLQGPRQKELEALVRLLRDGAGWEAMRRLERLSVEHGGDPLALAERHAALVARIDADRELNASVRALVEDPALARLARDAATALGTRSGRLSLALRIAAGRS